MLIEQVALGGSDNDLDRRVMMALLLALKEDSFISKLGSTYKCKIS